MSDATRDTTFMPGVVPNLSIHDMVALASRQLRGTAHPIDGGYVIDVRDYGADRWIALELTRSQAPEGGTNLRITSYRLKNQEAVSVINLVTIQHLYVTWQTKGMISFCYAGDGRYKLINVTYDNGVVVVEDMDRRRPRTDDDMSESERRARAQRRTFYHIGRNFDQVEAHDPTQPMEGSMEAEERRAFGENPPEE